MEQGRGEGQVGTRCCIWARDMAGLCKVAAQRDEAKRSRRWTRRRRIVAH